MENEKREWEIFFEIKAVFKVEALTEDEAFIAFAEYIQKIRTEVELRHCGFDIPYTVEV